MPIRRFHTGLREPADSRLAGKPQAGVFRLRQRVSEIHESYEREVRDLPRFEYRTTVATAAGHCLHLATISRIASTFT